MRDNENLICAMLTLHCIEMKVFLVLEMRVLNVNKIDIDVRKACSDYDTEKVHSIPYELGCKLMANIWIILFLTHVIMYLDDLI